MCVSEEIQNNVIVMADYVIYPDENTRLFSLVSVLVTSPHGNSIHHEENVTHGRFGFTSSEEGAYLACFWVDNGHKETGGEVSLILDWKTGIAAKNWDSFAKKEKIEGVELEIQKLEEAVEAIYKNLVYL